MAGNSSNFDNAIFILLYMCALIDYSCSIMAHDADTGAILWFVESAHADGVSAVKQSHNGRFILSGGVHGEVRLWEMRSRELISHLKEHTQKITNIEIFLDDTTAVTCSRDRSIMRWDLRGEVSYGISCTSIIVNYISPLYYY
jgi:WD40 repeat protein